MPIDAEFVSSIAGTVLGVIGGCYAFWKETNSRRKNESSFFIAFSALLLSLLILQIFCLVEHGRIASSSEKAQSPLALLVNGLEVWGFFSLLTWTSILSYATYHESKKSQAPSTKVLVAIGVVIPLVITVSGGLAQQDFLIAMQLGNQSQLAAKISNTWIKLGLTIPFILIIYSSSLLTIFSKKDGSNASRRKRFAFYALWIGILAVPLIINQFVFNLSENSSTSLGCLECFFVLGCGISLGANSALQEVEPSYNTLNNSLNEKLIAEAHGSLDAICNTDPPQIVNKSEVSIEIKNSKEDHSQLLQQNDDDQNQREQCVVKPEDPEEVEAEPPVDLREDNANMGPAADPEIIVGGGPEDFGPNADPENYPGDDLNQNQGEVENLGPSADPENYPGDDSNKNPGEVENFGPSADPENYPGDDLNQKSDKVDLGPSADPENYPGDDSNKNPGEVENFGPSADPQFIPSETTDFNPEESQNEGPSSDPGLNPADSELISGADAGMSEEVKENQKSGEENASQKQEKQEIQPEIQSSPSLSEKAKEKEKEKKTEKETPTNNPPTVSTEESKEVSLTLTHTESNVSNVSEDPTPSKSSTTDFGAVSKMLEIAAKIKDVSNALKEQGLREIQLILAIDCTSSNHYTGKKSFFNKCLHEVSKKRLNFYEQVISIMGSVVNDVSPGGKIPVYLFGDTKTKDKSVRPMRVNKDGSEYCDSLEQVLSEYRRVIPKIDLSGPTSFKPIIEKAISLYKQTKKFHLLIIIGDGAVTNISETAQAISAASEYGFATVMVGVGDGDVKQNPQNPWEGMEKLDSELPDRKFDNFTFVQFTSSMGPAEFAEQALKELPQAYKYCEQNGLVE